MEPTDDLQDDVKLLLEGSRGKISKAIIIKIEPMRKGETAVQTGWVEMWNWSDGKARKVGGRKVSFYNYPISSVPSGPVRPSPGKDGMDYSS